MELDEALPEEVAESVHAMEATLSKLETALQPLWALPSTPTPLDPESRCQHLLLLAYAINSTYHSFLKTRGIAVGEHPVLHELTRAQSYFSRYHELKSAKSSKAVLDADAAERMVRSGTGNHRIKTKKLGKEKKSKEAKKDKEKKKIKKQHKQKSVSDKKQSNKRKREDSNGGERHHKKQRSDD